MIAKTYDTIILGAGAAGLMCALIAGQRGRRVLVLDRANKAGKKILMSGGGRCNFTNLHVSPDRFLSANPHYCKSALSRYTQWDFIEMVERHDIGYFEKQTVNGLSGQLFCHQSSKQVVAMLLAECNRAGVEIRLQCETVSVDNPSGFDVKTDQGRFVSETLVVATGGLSVPSLGGSPFGYELARQFGLRLLPTSAGLVPFTFTDAMHEVCRDLSGLSLEAVLSNQRASFREDILFTHRGISGPAALQLSSYWRPGEAFSVNLLPAMDARTTLHDWKNTQAKTVLRTPLSRHLPRKLVGELERQWWPDYRETALAEWPDRLLEEIAAQLSAWNLKPAATEGYRTAEVTLGGIDTRDLSSRTMESAVPGLFFVGEVVDVSGHLGGFNFQWAWSSGWVAGQSV